MSDSIPVQKILVLHRSLYYSLMNTCTAQEPCHCCIMQQVTLQLVINVVV